MYRKEVSSNTGKNFVRLNRLGKGEQGQAQFDKKSSTNESQTVGFKHLKYEVSESNGHVSVMIEKKTNKEFSFWVRTFEGTAKVVEDYIHFDERITMKADEMEREIKVGIVDDEGWEPDEDFYIRLLDEVDQSRLPGDDTECTVTILDEDKPGNIGFAER